MNQTPPEGNWKFYLCRVNNKIASVFFNAAIRQNAPDGKRPTLLWVWLYMNQPEDNGLSSNDEFQQLNVIEDVLNKAVAETLNPEFVGRITTDGHREFYYYAPDDKGLNQVHQARLEMS